MDKTTRRNEKKSAKETLQYCNIVFHRCNIATTCFKNETACYFSDEEEGIAKPDARTYLRTLLRLGVQPEEAMFVDDKLENVEAAHQLGMHSIHFQQTEQALVEIQKILQTA